jgi:hypothetical protein
MEDTKRAFISYSSPGLVLSGLFVVFQVELPDGTLKKSAHRVVVDTRRREAGLRVAGRGGVGECCELIAEFEIDEESSENISGKPVEVVLEIGK